MNIVLVAGAITGSKTATVLTALQKELQIQAPAANPLGPAATAAGL